MEAFRLLNDEGFALEACSCCWLGTEERNALETASASGRDSGGMDIGACKDVGPY